MNILPFTDDGVAATTPLPRERVFKIQWPKSDSRALGLPNKIPDSEFWQRLGFERELRLNKQTYTLRDTTGELSDIPVQIQVTERKGDDIAALLATPDRDGWAQGNMGLAGIDTLTEFYKMQKNHAAARMDATLTLQEIMDTDLSRGAIVWITRDETPIRSFRDFAREDVVTKYPNQCFDEVRRVERNLNGIGMGKIKPRKGGIEYDFLDDRYLQLAMDFIQSGGSAVDAGLKLAFANESLWAPIREGRAKFDDMTPQEMKELPGVVATSSGVLVRPFQQSTEEQEKIASVLERRIFDLISSLGRNPVLMPVPKGQRPQPVPRVYSQPQQEIGHGWRHRA